MFNEISWSKGTWTNEPPMCREHAEKLIAQSAEGSDYWQTTMYGFQRDSGHSLLVPWNGEQAVEVSFQLTGFDDLYDQAGLMLWSRTDLWIKSGIEINDGVPHLGAVATAGNSDWSLAPIPEWLGKTVTIRASKLNDAVIFRARADDEAWRTVRVCPLQSDAAWQVGPYLCSPKRSGFQVVFTRWSLTEPDTDIHTQPNS